MNDSDEFLATNPEHRRGTSIKDVEFSYIPHSGCNLDEEDKQWSHRTWNRKQFKQLFETEELFAAESVIRQFYWCAVDVADQMLRSKDMGLHQDCTAQRTLTIMKCDFT